MKITYFVHSITTDNEKGLATGWLQGELSEEGIKRIKLLPGLIVDKSFESIYPSDLKRAIQSYRDTEKRILEFLEEKKNEGKEHIAIMGHEATQLALEVICNNKTWPEAIRGDWRPTQSWKPGWLYHFI